MSCSSVTANNEPCRVRSLGQPDGSTYASFMYPLVPGDKQESSLRENADPLILENAVRMQWWLGELRQSEFYSGVPTRAIITGIAVSEKDKVGVSEKDMVGASEKYKVKGKAYIHIPGSSNTLIFLTGTI